MGFLGGPNLGGVEVGGALKVGIGPDGRCCTPESASSIQ